MGELDLRAIYQSYEKDGRGQAAYPPVMRVKLLFYGYGRGVVASRKIEAASHENVALRYWSAHEHPDHSSLAEFRRHWEALAALFWEVLKLCQKAGLVKLGHVALDGTKIKAHASRHRNWSYQRLSETERPLAQQVEEHTGAKPEQVSVDTDYYRPPPVPAPSREGIDRYVRPDDPPKINASKVSGRAGLKQVKPPRSGYGPDGIPRSDHLRAKLATPAGQAVYAQRREIVEPVFGQIKQCRGLRQFLVRGLEKTRAEWRLICLTHNLLKLYRSGWTPQTA